VSLLALRRQLQQAGKEEEHTCRFCLQKLTRWSAALLEEPAAAEPVVAIMAVRRNS
jgi:hypothetical protein